MEDPLQGKMDTCNPIPDDLPAASAAHESREAETR